MSPTKLTCPEMWDTCGLFIFCPVCGKGPGKSAWLQWEAGVPAVGPWIASTFERESQNKHLMFPQLDTEWAT